MVHATIVGRFFSGEQVKYPKGVYWGGYGHMGCCSLLMIQQVLAVDPHDRGDLDYRASADQPNITKAGCGYTDLLPLRVFDELLLAQRQADSGQRAWAFDDPQRVAIDALAHSLEVDQISIKGLTTTRQSPRRIVYQWKPPRRRGKTYMVVVSRPYWLSFYSHDRNKVAWGAIAAYESSCEKDNSVTLIK